MDQVSSQKGSHENPVLGPGLLNFPKDLHTNRSKEDVYPSRPSSRLGFNRTTLSTRPPEAPPGADAVQWSHSLFQTVGISDLRLSSIKPQPTSMVDPPSPGCQVENVTNEALLPSRNKNPTNPECGNGPSAFTRSQAVSRKLPKSSHPSVSRLCFPFVTTSSPRRNKPPPSPPPPRHKYSCFPSSMSPLSPGRPAPRHQRHNYRQHGYSRLALLQVKWFWSLREEEWEGQDMQTRSTAAQGGVPPNGNVTFPLHPSTTGPGTPAISNPDTVYPRFGDIKTLRDPYCIQVDQHFATLQPWTVRKILWMFEVLRVNEKRSIKPQVVLEEDPSDAESESELESSSASTTFGDDSDTTLVESESEMDLQQNSASSVKKAFQTKIDHETRYAGPSSIDFFALRAILENGTWLQSMQPIASKSDGIKLQWATNWYERWTILLELFQCNQGRRHVLFDFHALGMGSSSLANGNIPGKRSFLVTQVMDSDDEDS
ncbi:hypothetical protein CPB84DRAFT_1762090 [Gymnopilus junonius]|uniref:Uncharacterized protein n=1 Tax=Gymnopilus junonius TaxID=109634 RepID=A0A9P5NX35_GYMJU|nr:hypothetical protein CPB84DRAFT_1762090 [Gymnopilus junonius]